jgi:membrane fusion protein (multidrug efflux system)
LYLLKNLLKNMNKTIKNILILLVIVIILFLIIYPKIQKTSESLPKPDTKTATASSASLVEVVVATKRVLQDKVVSTGTILPNESVNVTSEVSAVITGIHFKEGSQVVKGTTLVTLNDAELRAHLQQLYHKKKLAELDEKRKKELLAREAISRQEYDIAETELSTLTAQIAQIKATIDKYTIKAPFSGTVGIRQVSEGSYVSPNVVITQIADFNTVKIEFAVAAKYANQIFKGQNIRFTVENSNKEYQAKVYATATQIDEATRTITVRAICSNDKKELIPGAFANVTLILSEQEKLTIPTQALVPEMGGYKVYVVNNQKAAEKKVKTGIRTEKDIEIVVGIEEGDSVITAGLMNMRDGVPVKIK